MALPGQPVKDPHAPRFVELGRFGKSHALDGEVRFFCSRALESHLSVGALAYMKEKNNLIPVRVVSVREQPGLSAEKREAVLFFVKLDRIQNREDADRLRDHLLYVQKSPEVTALLEGAKEEEPVGYTGFVVYNRDLFFGLVKEVLETAAHPVLFVDSGGREVLIPCTPPFILRQDVEQKILFGRDLEQFLEY